jgi:hypothetical protein
MTKLTLSVDEQVVQRAKAYAAGRGTSVSSLVERLLDMVASPPKSTGRAPVLARVRGSLGRGSVAHYRKYLERKYR